MTSYSCKRCGFETAWKQSLKQHLKKKTECDPVLADCSREELLQEITKTFESPPQYCCRFCQKAFHASSNRYRHQKTCPQRTTEASDTPLVDQVASMQQQLQTLLQERIATTNHTTHNTHIENMQVVNLQFNAFGKENMSHITHTFLDRCVKRTNAGFIDLLQKLHFDQSAKQNANIRVTNKKLPYVETNDGTMWKFERKDCVLNKMLDKGQEILQEHLDDHAEELKQTFSETMWEYVQEWFQKIELRDKKVIEELLTDVFLMIMNNSRTQGYI